MLKKINYFELIKTLLVFSFCSLIVACSPKVEIAIPDKPININMNIKIDHEVRIRVEKDLENVISEKSDLF